MYVCMCKYMHVYVCKYMHVCVCIYIHTCVYIYIYIYTYIYIPPLSGYRVDSLLIGFTGEARNPNRRCQFNVYSNIHIYIYVYSNIHTSIHPSIHTYTYVRTCVYICIYIQTLMSINIEAFLPIYQLLQNAVLLLRKQTCLTYNLVLYILSFCIFNYSWI